MAGLESATYINQLNPLNPSDTLDYVSTGDDHIRLIKSTLLNTFSRITSPVPASGDDLTNTTYLADSGTANSIILTFSPVWTSYASGKGVIFKANATNTGATTVNINSLGSKSVVNSSNQALTAGDIISGQIYHMVYNGTAFNLAEARNTLSGTIIQITPYTGTNATFKNSSTGTLILGTNGNSNVTLNANGTTTLAGSLTGTSATFSGTITASGGITGPAGTFFPSGTVIPFFQAAAPTGWTQVTTHNNKMLRVVSTAGGGSGGSHSPILMDKVPSHTHTDTFAATTASAGAHTHTLSHVFTAADVEPYNGGDGSDFNMNNSGATSSDGAHTHTVTITGSVGTNSGADNWEPYYINMILASKN